MTFKEDYPSLEDLEFENNSQNGIYDGLYSASDIEDHCRDNKKIIEAIDNFQNNWDASDECINELKEELRLK